MAVDSDRRDSIRRKHQTVLSKRLIKFWTVEDDDEKVEVEDQLIAETITLIS